MAIPPSNTRLAGELLERAHTPETAETILLERVKQRPLILRPTSPDPQQNARSKRQYARLQKERARRRSNKPKPLSARQKRALCLYDIPKHLQKFAIYEPLHRMWCGYMREILGMEEGGARSKQIDGQMSGPILASADYHGALVEIVRSRCVSRVGLRGIVAKDTKFTFEIITPANELKVVPKEHTVFQIEVPWTLKEGGINKPGPLVFEIYGSQFETRAPDRANKKFRFHYDPEL